MKSKLTMRNTKLGRYPWLLPLLEKIFYINEMNAVIDNFPEKYDTEILYNSILSQLNISAEYVEADLKKIPPTGPLFVVANHPTGIIDSLLIASLIYKVRKDIKLLVNSFFVQLDYFDDFFIPVDVFNPKSNNENMRALLQAQRWLKNEGVLMLFPAGLVSHWQWQRLKATDSAWSESVAWLSEKSQAPVLPFYIHASNKWYFHVAGLISPRLRTVLLPQQFFDHKNATIKVSIGNPILPAEYNLLANPKDKTLYLRHKTYELAKRDKLLQHSQVLQPIIPPIPSKELDNAIKLLPPEALLVSKDEYDVYLSQGKYIPTILTEISRLRELTYRNCDFGTGKPNDTDLFDSCYYQLFVWNKNEKKIVGGYRFVLVEDPAQVKSEKIYSQCYYNIANKFFTKVAPAIELGRAFVIPEYQRKKDPFMLLWRGLAAFITVNPKYRYFFGRVDVYSSYQTMSKDLIVSFLRRYELDQELSPLVKSKNPYSVARYFPNDWYKQFNHENKFSQLNQLIAAIEPNHEEVPILMNLYHDLGAKFCDCTVDPLLNNSLEFFIVLDIKKIPLSKFRYFMGAEGAKKYYEYHGVSVDLSQK